MHSASRASGGSIKNWVMFDYGAQQESSAVMRRVLAKHLTVMLKFMKRQSNGKRQTREPPKNNIDSS